MEGGEKKPVVASAGGAQDKTIVNKIMLRFRPIAPKPLTGSTVEGDSPVGNKSPLVTCKRSKRKYVRVRKDNDGEKRIRSRVSDPEKDKEDCNTSYRNLVTLQLLPEKDDRKEDENSENYVNGTVDRTDENSRDAEVGLMMSLIKDDRRLIGLPLSSDQTVVVESWVTLERVTGPCTGEGARNKLGCTDEERVKSLEADTCPGFISDGLNRVCWINGAYREMLGLSSGDHRLPPETETRVYLLAKEQEEMLCMGVLYGGVTCRVRLQYASTWRNEKKRSKDIMVPCDVWRMDFGGFAWRLDVEAALTLGR